MSDDRYLRHSLIDWFDQKQVRASRVVVVGAGAVGNEVLKDLCLLGVGTIHVIDFDRIEIHNLTRSVLFSESDVGQNKAEVAAAACKRIEPNVSVSYSTQDFWASLTLTALGTYDALMCCVDNFEARLRLNQMCLLAGVDFYNTAIDSRFVTVEAYPFGAHGKCACYECNLSPSVYTRVRERYSCGWLKRRAFEEKKIPTTTVTASIAGALACSSYLRQHDNHSLRGAARYYLDTIELYSSRIHLDQSPDCPACSSVGEIRHVFQTGNIDIREFAHDAAVPESTCLWLSDKLITTVACRFCRTSRTVNDLASRYDDSVLYCPVCRSHSNDVTIKDTMTMGEMFDRFRAARLPCKYVYFFHKGTQFVLEKEASDE